MHTSVKYVVFNPTTEEFIGMRRHTYGAQKQKPTKKLQHARVFSRPGDAAYQKIEGFEIRQVHITMEEGPFKKETH